MRATMHHPSDEALVALIDDELPLAERQAIEAHLRGCSACVSKAATMQATLTRVSTDLRSQADADAGERRARLRRALRDVSSLPDPSTSPGVFERLSPALWLQAAAVLLLSVTIWTMTKGSDERRGGGGHADRETLASASDRPLHTATPGAVSAHTAAELCAGVRPSRVVSDATRRQVLAQYRMEHVSADEYELDALITPELGGTADAANLWPQRYDLPVWNARVKDDLENLLPAMVCRGEVDLVSAQQAIAADWIAAYRKFFRTETPLTTDRAPDEENELVFLPASYAGALRAAR